MQNCESKNENRVCMYKNEGYLETQLPKKKEMLNKIFSANETSDAFNLEWTVLELPVNEIYQKLKYSQ